MSLYTITDVRQYIKENKIEDIEVYKFNSIKKSVHTDSLDFIGFDLTGIGRNQPVHTYRLMDYDEYSSTVEANGEPAFNEEDYNKKYPNGILIVVLDNDY